MASVESADADTSVLQAREVLRGKRAGADVVVKQANVQARFGAFYQGICQFQSCAVFADDEELDENMPFGSEDAFNYGGKHSWTIDEQVTLVVCEKRHRGYAGVHRPLGVGCAVYIRCVTIEDVRFNLGDVIADLNVIIQPLPCEDEVERDRWHGDEKQREQPGNAALRGARVHDLANGANDCQSIEKNTENCDQGKKAK